MIQANNRDLLLKYLVANGIEAKIHYPTPLHLQPASKKLGLNTEALSTAETQASKLLTLPIHQYLEKPQIEYMFTTIAKFYGK